jgi:hypothetical protein
LGKGTDYRNQYDIIRGNNDGKKYQGVKNEIRKNN